MQKIRKGDIVQAIKGKDKGKRGKIIQFLSESNKAVVEGLNMVKKHKRKTQNDQKGGIVSIELPISLANIMLVCKRCDKPVRTGFSISKDKSKSRICKVCKEVI